MEQTTDYASLTRRALRRHHLTQAALAKRLRVHRSSVAQWLAGDTTPTGPAQVLLEALATGQVPDWLRTETAAPPETL